VRTGCNKIGRGPQIAACGDGLNHGAGFCKKRGPVIRFEQPMHSEVLRKRAGIPFGEGTDLKKMGL
jgi:hypothetical protein